MPNLGADPVSTPAEYRERAAECVHFSRATRSPRGKALYVALAQAWLKLARQIEAREERDPGVMFGGGDARPPDFARPH
jgi:hypothetical protein